MIVTLLATSHATVAFHFCSGKLHSVALAGSEIKSCCKEEESHEGKNMLQNTPCCSNHYQVISTDDFSINQQEKIAGNDTVFHPAAFILSPAIVLSDPVAAQTFQHIFPPGGIARSGADLLTLICIYRI